jgi:hypothetical protein
MYKIWLQFVQILSISLYTDVFLNIFNLKFVVLELACEYSRPDKSYSQAILELNVCKFQSNFVHTSVRSAS